MSKLTDTIFAYRKLIGIFAGVFAGFSLFIGIIIWAFFMHTEVVEPGNELVINDKPYFFGHDGVRATPLKEGRVLLFKTSSVTSVNMMPKSVKVAVDDFSSSDKFLLDFETIVQFRVNDSVKLVKDFGPDWFNNNIQSRYLAIVREAVKKKTMIEMLSGVAAAEVDKEVTVALVALVKESGLPITVLDVSLGRAKPNAEVLAQMNETAAQQQRKLTLIEAEAAEIQRKREQIAKAAAADNA